jgi:hypothetical protein
LHRAHVCVLEVEANHEELYGLVGVLPRAADSAQSRIVMGTGNPWVVLTIPVPIPSAFRSGHQDRKLTGTGLDCN